MNTVLFQSFFFVLFFLRNALNQSFKNKIAEVYKKIEIFIFKRVTKSILNSFILSRLRELCAALRLLIFIFNAIVKRIKL